MCPGRSPSPPSLPGYNYYFSNIQPGVNGFYGRISYFRAWIDGEMTSATFCGGTADAS